jgi:site-specific recombinase XerD
MKTNSFLSALSDYFVSYLPDTKGLSNNTITSYQYAFQLLFEFMGSVKGVPPEKAMFITFDSNTVSEFLLWLEKERACSAATRNLRRAAISAFAKFAARKNLDESLQFYSAVAAIPRKKTPKNSDIKYFSKEEISILLNLPDTQTAIGKRDAVLMSVLYASGARAQELCDLTVNDIYFGNETNVRLVGKGSKARLVTIPQNCSILLKNWLFSRNLNLSIHSDRLRHVFSSQTHEHMSISCIEEIVKKYVERAKEVHPDLFGLGKYSPHSFRHSIAVHMLECGESLVVIKAFLGHASISTTTIYASVTPELANKYLRERGKPIDMTGIEQTKQVPDYSTSLPFLKKISSGT